MLYDFANNTDDKRSVRFLYGMTKVLFCLQKLLIAPYLYSKALVLMLEQNLQYQFLINQK